MIIVSGARRGAAPCARDVQVTRNKSCSAVSRSGTDLADRRPVRSERPQASVVAVVVAVALAAAVVPFVAFAAVVVADASTSWVARVCVRPS